jgi:hypothetical protein
MGVTRQQQPTNSSDGLSLLVLGQIGRIGHVLGKRRAGGEGQLRAAEGSQGLK